MNRRQAECLIRSGALDHLGATRATMFASLDSLLSSTAATEKDRLGGQVSLFKAKPKIKIVEEWADRIRLNDEKHLLGTYVSGHPIRAYQALLQSFKTTSISQLVEGKSGGAQEVSVAGLVTSVKEIFTKKGTKMAFVNLEDRDAAIEVVVFPDLFSQKTALLVKDRLLLIKGQVSREGDVVKILGRDISDLSNVQFSELHLRLKKKDLVTRLSGLADRAKKYPGEIKVKVHVPVDGEVEGIGLKQSYVTVDTAYRVQTHPELMSFLDGTFGEGSVSLR